MLPRAVVELEHDRLGRIGRVEVDIGKEHVAFTDPQARIGVREVMLTYSRGRACRGPRAAEDGPFLFGNEFPGAVALRLGAWRQVVLDPDVFLRPRCLRRSGHRRGRRLDVVDLSKLVDDLPTNGA